MLLSSVTPKTNLSQIQEHLEELKYLQKRDTLNDNYNGCSLKMSLMSDDAFHLKNPITSIFNVEVSLHVCSFYHRFGHLLASCPNRSS